MTEHVKELAKADLNICLSDGHITDSPINKEFYESKNIKVYGMYVGDYKSESANKLKKWFQVGLVRSSVTELVHEFMLRLEFKK